MIPPWGYLLSLDLHRCTPGIVKCRATIDRFARTLVHRIDMKPFGDPQILHFGDGPRAGYTLVQLIHTSCITGHFCDESDSAYLDVFSCKPFEPKDVQKVVAEYFGPQHVTQYYTTRGAQFRVAKSGLMLPPSGSGAFGVQSRAQSPGEDVLGGRPLI